MVKTMHASSVYVFLLGLASLVESSDSFEETTCGYESCPATKEGMLNVHLVPHTHDDVGWLKTVDEYYFGDKQHIARAGVQYILDSVIEELLKDPARRFIYVETAFFWKWWKEQNDIVKNQVQSLVQSGRLEFISGGWSMNDEAATHYHSTIDQFTWGFRTLSDIFGECARPKVGWQIDPFGHSREMASLMAQFGFDGLLFGRLDYQDKSTRLNNKTAEMIWQGSPRNLGQSANLFTSVLFNNYSPPPSFCFDMLCNDAPIIDDKESPNFNAEERVEAFIKLMEKQKHHFRSNNIIVTMGDDFNYQSANNWYKNMDKLIRYVNAKQENGSNINLLYSTPSCYLKAVNQADLSYITKDDDFFPYASDPHSYWTGYFTSRPTIKYYERKGNNFLQICKQLSALTDVGQDKDNIEGLNALRSAMGVLQHHDAITGTEKEQVAYDYALQLSKGINKCETIVDAALRKVIEKTEGQKTAPSIQMLTCPLLNISQCEISENFDTFVVTVYNPLSRPVTHYVRLPVPEDGKAYSVLCPMGREQVTQLVPIPETVQNIPGRFSQAKFELVFKAANLPPLGFRSYYVTQNVTGKTHVSRMYLKCKKNIIGNPAKTSLTVDKDNKTFTITALDKAVSLSIGFYYYKGYRGNNWVARNRSSGAYIFRPNGTHPISISHSPEIKTFKGPIFDEFHIYFSDWVSGIVRIYRDELYTEFNWLVGPIPITDRIGKEVISRYSTTLKSGNTFYTDSNGREILKRVRDYRPTWKLNLSEPVAGNYYPVTSKITIQEDSTQFSVLTDRAEGGSSLNEGQVELMVHRRLLNDDAFGVEEALNESAYGKGLVVRGTHYITILGPAVEKLISQSKLLDSWVFLTPAPRTTFEEWSDTYNMEFSGLTKALPPNVQILTLEPWKESSFLLRLEHIFEVHEDSTYSKPVTVNLETLFSPFKIISAQETTLGANLLLKNMKRMVWKSLSNEIEKERNEDIEDTILDLQSNLTVSLNPMQIRTFIINVNQTDSSAV